LHLRKRIENHNQQTYKPPSIFGTNWTAVSDGNPNPPHEAETRQTLYSRRGKHPTRLQYVINANDRNTWYWRFDLATV